MTPDSIEQVALVTGRIIHSGTGEAITGSISITAKEGEVAYTSLTDGTFAVSGRPDVLFPQLSQHAYQLNLEIHADSAQFIQGKVNKSLTVTIPKGLSFDLPINVGVVLLAADPATIRGRVVKAKDPATSLGGALLEVLQSSIVTNSTMTSADGRYRFDAITVLAPAEIRCSLAGYKTQKRTLLIDFGKSVNEEYFRLAP